MHPSMRPPILSPLVKKKIILYSCSSLSLSYKDTLTRFFPLPVFFVLGYVFYVLWDKEVLFREKKTGTKNLCESVPSKVLSSD